MLRLHGIIGLADDPAYSSRLHELEHRDALEFLHVPPSEAGRKRFRLTTDRGTECGVSMDRDDALADGAILHLDEDRAIIVRFGEQAVWRLRPATRSIALKLGWNAGNLHWRVRFEEEDLVVLLDGPLAEYRDRLRFLIADGAVAEITDV